MICKENFYPVQIVSNAMEMQDNQLSDDSGFE